MHLDKKLITIIVSSALLGGILGGVLGSMFGSFVVSEHNERYGWDGMYRMMQGYDQDGYLYPDTPTTPDQSGTDPVTGQVVAGEGEHCGGNMMNAPVCATGYHCAATPGSHMPMGDIGGTCVKD